MLKKPKKRDSTGTAQPPPTNNTPDSRRQTIRGRMNQTLKFLKAVDRAAFAKGQGQKHFLSVVVNYKYLCIMSAGPGPKLGLSFRFPSLIADEFLLTLLGRRERNKAAFAKEYPQLSSLVEAGVSGLLVGRPVPKRYWYTDPLPMESKYNTRERMAPTFIDSIDKPAYKDLMICFNTDYGTME